MDIRERLTNERDRLRTLRDQVEAGDPAAEASETAALSELSSADQHPADVGSELFEKTKDRSIIAQLDAQLEDVDRALGKVGGNTYGRCEACGQEIDVERLEAVPTARFCVDDQQRAEREAG
jgi:DnaK suppressor protein